MSHLALQHGHEVSIIDTRVSSTNEVLNAITNRKYRLVGITATTLTFEEGAAIAKAVKKIDPIVYIVIGSSHVTMATTEVMKSKLFNFTVYGEGEKTSCELVRLIESNTLVESELKKIHGLIFRIKDRIVTMESRRHIANLDDVPFPAIHLFDLNKYIFHRILTSRGCPFGCNFCLVNQIWGRKVRYRSVENIIVEVKQVLKHH